MISQNYTPKILLGDIQVDLDYQILQASSGRQIQLRRKEFQLLKFLNNNLNLVINKYVILDLLWDFNNFSSSNTLEVHLSNLRHKISQLSQQVRIDTIRGVGYRLVYTPVKT